jgi:uncharacterized damage-inducible protein DinB
MERRNLLIEDNIKMLEHGIEAIESMGNSMFSNPKPPFLQNGVGSHFRHCIDFYACFLSSVETGKINYAVRKRNRLVEIDGSLAILEIEAIIEKLRRLSPADLQKRALVVGEDSSTPLDQTGWSQSSLMRELQYLLSHTIHHFALIALTLRLQGFEPGKEFGVAPSTLAYWKQTA